MRVFLIIVFCISIQYILLSQNLKVTSNDTCKLHNDPDTVYWFYIRAKISINRNTNKPAYVISTLSGTPKSGSLTKFDKDLWRNLQGGRNLVIGPFYSENEANIAHKIYNCASKNQELNITKSKEQLYWFEMKYKISKRKRSYILEANRKVFSGNYNDFYKAMKIGLKNERLLVGPFNDYEYVKEMLTPRKTNCGM